MAKVCGDRIGLLDAVHRLRNTHTLTVVMFHRVLPVGLMEGADPAYTVSTDLFRQCLSFFRRHYVIVGMDAVIAAQGGGKKLPGRSLLITFDDGWDDTLAFAAPCLAAEAMPAAVFVSTDAVADQGSRWWQEVLLAAWRQGRARFDQLWNAIAADGDAPAAGGALDLLLRYGAAAAADRDAALRPWCQDSSVRDMLTPERLQALATTGMAVGAHGAAHLPLTLIDQPGADLERSWRRLSGWLAGAFSPVLSFPHGRHGPALISAAFSTGFKLLFTSDGVLNQLVDGRPAAVLGRIEMAAAQLAGPDGRLQHHRLATWLFLRQRRHLGSLRSLADAQKSMA